MHEQSIVNEAKKLGRKECRPVGAASCRDTVRTWKVLLPRNDLSGQESGIQGKIGSGFGAT
ncbi:MAG TPA: hypothetical protein ENN18_01900 [Proteobacteria bacterium]|nr:hypothetical protein [Pseudomonadota bacterium]